MGRVDTAWLRMDSDSNRMVILGVWVFDSPLSLHSVRQRLRQRLLRHPRFTQRVVEDAWGAYWEDDPGFDLRRHVVPEHLGTPRPQDEKRALEHRLSELASRPLDPRHPLWCMHWVPRYRGGSALLVRIHHCIGDGAALVALMQSLVDDAAPALQAPCAPPGGAQALHPFAGWAAKAIDPWGLGTDLAALALMPDDGASPLKGRLGGRKRVAWCAPVPLDRVKAVAKALGCTVNDVLLACVAGAMGRYLGGRGTGVQGQELRAMVPVNLRTGAQALELGNGFGLVPVLLPLGLENPLERLYRIKARMRALKDGWQPALSYGLLALAGCLARPAQQALLELFARKAAAVVTNVPGPNRALHFCGARIGEVLFWVPQSADVGLGLSILSYAGAVQLGVLADTALCPDPQSMVDAFAPEFERLCTLTLMLPWGVA
ncbi:MAG: wax ester/triacylglycerol synthase family O-acyltransferase [Rhodoferax sp.]